MRKTYRFLGIPVWVVETDDPDPETDDTEGTCQLNAHMTQPTEPPPPFGFTPIPFYWDED